MTMPHQPTCGSHPESKHYHQPCSCDHYQKAFDKLYDLLFNPITGEAWPLQPHILQGLITNFYLPKEAVKEAIEVDIECLPTDDDVVPPPLEYMYKNGYKKALTDVATKLGI